jgi:hypothetical protein
VQRTRHPQITLEQAGVVPRRASAEAPEATPVANNGVFELPTWPGLHPDGAAAAESREFAPAERSEAICRVVNVVIAAIALLILAPVCVIVALAVKLTSRGPVFYTQTRVGLDRRWTRTRAINERRVEDLGGQPFTILKFRSMTVDAEANGQAVWATKHDARVTPVGRVIRKTRLDEIPQLINVLRGEMNTARALSARASSSGSARRSRSTRCGTASSRGSPAGRRSTTATTPAWKT